MDIRLKSNIALLIAILELAMVPILLDFGGTTSGSIELLFYVFLIASLISVPIAYALDRKGLRSIVSSNKTLAVIIVAGLCNSAITSLLYAIGTIGTNPSIAAIVFRGWILIAAILTPIVLKNRISPYQIGAIVMGFFGLFIVLSQGTLSISAAFSPAMLFLLGAAFVTAIAILLIKRYNASTVASIAVFNVASFIFIAGLALFLKTSIFNPVSLQFAAAALFLGVVTYGIGSSLYFYAFKHLGQMLVGNATLGIPLITIFLSFALIGTQLHAYYFYAAIIMAAAVVAQQYFSSKAPEYIKSRESKKRLQFFDVTSAFVASKEMSENVSGAKRALAVKLNGNMQMFATHSKLLDMYGCVIFTNREPYKNTEDEVDFVNHIMGAKEDDTILVGLGETAKIESAFEELISAREEPLVKK